MMEAKRPESEAIHGPSGLELITCIVQRGRADKVAKAAMEAGAGGVTINFARGMGLRERMGLLGLAIVPEKETLTVVCNSPDTTRIFNAIAKAAKLDVPGMGIAYVQPVSAVAGHYAPAESLSGSAGG